jgi:two-component system sensor histidine kinase KdpD
MDVAHEAMGERAGRRSGAWASLPQLAGPWWVFLITELVWLIISVIVLRFTLASVAIVGVLLGVIFLLGAFGEFLIAATKASLPLGRRLAGYGLAAAVAPLLTLVLASLRSQLDLTTDVLAFLVAVIAVALAGGLIPVVLAAVGGSLLISFYFTPLGHTVTIAGADDAAVLDVFVAVALAVSLIARDAARRTRQAARAAAEYELLATAAASVLHGPEALTAVLDQAREAFGLESVTLLERGPSVSNTTGRAVGWMPVAVSGGPPIARPNDAALMVPATSSLCLALGGRALPATSSRSLGAFAAFAAAALGQQRLAAAAEAARAIAEADRMRTALLAAVSHDLRTPLAAAKAAISCLRSSHIALTAEDRHELLATADESLNQLAHLIASLLDVSRLQAGALPVFPRPADLGEIITRSLDGFGPQARAVTVDFPSDLPQVMADPPLMERVIVNLAGNALRYSPAGSPPLLTAGAYGDRVELRVIDRGPGIPAAERDRAFLPFQRLGATSTTTGVGLGLTVSRGLTEAMGGTLEPEETPGGGLTMAISLPAVPARLTPTLVSRTGASANGADGSRLRDVPRTCLTPQLFSPGHVPRLGQTKIYLYRTSSGACPRAGTQAVRTRTPPRAPARGVG